MGTLTKGKIYIVHGWAYTLEKWESFLSELKKIGFEPVMLNVPGLTAPIDRPYTIDDYVSWLEKILENESGPVTLLGHSNGGRISLSYTIKNPSKVKNLILIGSAGLYDKGLLVTVKRKVFGTFAKLGSGLKDNKFLRKVLYKLVREKDYRDANPIMRKTMANLISVDLLPRLNEIKCPTLLIWGQNDGSTPLKDGKAMHQKISGSQLEIINDARHSPQFTNVENVIEIIKNYYGKTNI